MPELDRVIWPPAPITTSRLVLRVSEARDRAAFVDLFASPEVGLHLGGPRPREELERAVPDVPGRRPGLFVVELGGAMIGTVTLERRSADRTGGDLIPGDGLAELGYMFLPRAWGAGYAAEACAAVLDWFADSSPGERVVLCTQVANSRSLRLARKLGFTEVARFEEFGAEQWFGRWGPVAPPGRRARAPLPSGPEGAGPLLHNDH
ncbi:GNAT family N-acetyltransferase [Streptomyces californicus]|uniref:GNAT family N-acetyltransferase n=1 Tax=Streptomyces californicus TaxID=67351 RepID=UPI0036E37E4C